MTYCPTKPSRIDPGFATMPRAFAGSFGTPWTTGVPLLVTINLPVGTLVSNISLLAGTTAATNPTHWWFVLVDSSRYVRAVTADQTTTAWSGTAGARTLAVGTPYLITTKEVWRIGGMMVADTLPTLEGVGNTRSELRDLAPAQVQKTADSGLTTAPSLGTQFGALGTPGGANAAHIPYGWVT